MSTEQSRALAQKVWSHFTLRGFWVSSESVVCDSSWSEYGVRAVSQGLELHGVRAGSLPGCKGERQGSEAWFQEGVYFFLFIFHLFEPGKPVENNFSFTTATWPR
jgi:hypothetical protein